MSRWIGFLWIALTFILTSSTPEELKPFKLNGYAQGTTYAILYYSENKNVSSKQIDSILDVIDTSMSLYKKGSLINQFNSSEKGILLDPHFKKVIVKSLEVYKMSGGYFDITVAPLVQAWGFGATSLPDDTSIQLIKQHIGSNKLKLEGDFLYKTDPKVKIDLNGIAQGYSVDVLASFLEEKGIKNYLVELGGEIRVKGTKQPSNERFKIGIESTQTNNFEPEKMQASIQLDSGGITTSGNYRKFYMNGKRKVSHLIDPDTGYPLDNEMISATVYAKDAITADGFDNVFMGMGIKKSFLFLKSHPEMEVYFIYQKRDGSVADTATAGFYKFIKSQENDQKKFH